MHYILAPQPCSPRQAMSSSISDSVPNSNDGGCKLELISYSFTGQNNSKWHEAAIGISSSLSWNVEEAIIFFINWIVLEKYSSIYNVTVFLENRKKIIRITNSLYSRDDIELIDEEKVGEIVAEVRKKRGNKSKIPDPEKNQEEYGMSKFSNISSCSFHLKKKRFFFF